MKKILLWAMALIAGSMTMNAQDILTKKSGEDVQVIVKEINTEDVKYVLFSEPNGVIYTMPKSEILIIRYASGRNEVFSQAQTAPKRNNMYAPDYGGANLVSSGMKYNELKEIYDFRDWQGGYERYSPFWCGFASFFITGLGQMCAGEGLRGVGFLCANILISTVGLSSLYSDASGMTYLLCSCANLGLGIWSIVDATRVAKVKNMYETDLRSQYSDISIDLYPSLNPAFSQSGLGVAPGMTLAITF